jgi:hypothetical protein
MLHFMVWLCLRNDDYKDSQHVIGDEWSEEDHPTFSCSWCNRDLVRLSDRNNLSESWFCRNCQIPFDSRYPDTEEIQVRNRREEIEPAITSTGTIPDVSIRHEPELRGGFAALSKKGTIRFTSCHTTEKE